MNTRAQGRPRAGATVGRAGLLEAIRDFVRNEPQPDLARKVIALELNVTPALISYYFPRKDSLVQEVTEPVILAYLQRLQIIIGTLREPSARLRDVIALLAELYGRDANIVALYKAEASRSPSTNLLDEMAACLRGFFNEWRGPQSTDVCSFDAAVLHGTLWGMSEFFARLTQPGAAKANVIDDRYQAAVHHFFNSWMAASRNSPEILEPLVS